MKKILLYFFATCICVQSQAQGASANETLPQDIGKEISRLKELIKQLQENELQSDKAKYQKNHQLIVNGIDIIKEIHQGTVEISGARSQNMMYKKLIDVNNPGSEVLGFQLLDVINKILEENISLLPIANQEKKRLKGVIGNLFEGLKRTFPPLQIITSAFSAISSFNIFTPRIEKLSKKVDSLVVDVENPITGPIIKKINDQLLPYIDFYTELNKVNSNFENALYQHGVQYRDYVEEVNTLRETIEKKINLNESIGNKINDLFDITNSSAVNFNYKEKLNNETIKELVGNCIGIYDLVDRYKKFSNDFLYIQDDFYKNNIALLEKKAKKLPFRDDAKIDQLVVDLNELKNGNAAQNITGFDVSNKMRMKSILTKVNFINRLRY
ncbi:MAG: hypothetical protein H7Z13_14595 [Ferruginibacter sp.]|nr:hypothetical protein [Ferruginibacter sp.]